MKKYISLGIFPISSLFILATIMTILNLFEISLNKIIVTFLMIIITFISGITLGRKINDKGYLKGFLYGLSIAGTMFILSFILLSSHSLYNIIYYLIIIASTTLGTMFGLLNKAK